MSALVAPEICWNMAGAVLRHCPALASRPAGSEVTRPPDDIVSGAAEGRGAGRCPEVNKAASAGEAAPGFRACPPAS